MRKMKKYVVAFALPVAVLGSLIGSSVGAHPAFAANNYPNCRAPLVQNDADRSCDDPTGGSTSGSAATNPFGALDMARQTPTQGIRVVGWAIDPGATDPIDVEFYVDGKFSARTTADGDRPDVASKYPRYGMTGFNTTIPAGAGSHMVCAYGISAENGLGTQLGCKPVDVNPFGSLELARQSPTGGISVAGWAIDPDTGSPIDVHFYVDGNFSAGTNASGNRADVGAAYPDYGSAHGFNTTIPAGAGPHSVCAYGINVGPGQNWQLGCTQMDQIIDFQINSISYDLNHAQIVSTSIDSIYTNTVTNGTAVSQSSEIDGSKTVTETAGWSDALQIKVGVKTTLNIHVPILVDETTELSAEVQNTFTWNGSQQTAVMWSWKQPVIVPAHSQVRATVTVAVSELSVPYVLSGTFVYQSGFTVAGTISGIYTGVNSHNLAVNLQQSSASPLSQPQPSISRSVQR